MAKRPIGYVTKYAWVTGLPRAMNNVEGHMIISDLLSTSFREYGYDHIVWLERADGTVGMQYDEPIVSNVRMR